MMIDLWWHEARANGVIPLDDGAQARAFARDPQTGLRRKFVMYPGTRLLTPVPGPNFSKRSFRIDAYVERDDDSSAGVLFAYGRRAAGFALFVQNKRLWFDYNLAGRHTEISSPHEMPTGAHVLGCALTLAPDQAQVHLTVDGAPIGMSPLPMAFPAGFGVMSSQCGLNSPSPVSARYAAPFVFAGKLDRVEIELGDSGAQEIGGLWAAAIRRQ
jgi:arylsulfatase